LLSGLSLVSVCEVVLMSGLPGSGKDYWIEENLTDWPVISLDALRLEMDVSPDKNQSVVVDKAKKKLRNICDRELFLCGMPLIQLNKCGSN